MLLRSLILFLAWALTSLFCAAQVSIDTPLSFTGPDSSRFISGVADPGDSTAAVTYGALARGVPHWADASPNATGFDLTVDHASSSFSEGTLLRFLSPSTVYGPTSLMINGANAEPLRRADGLHPVQGDLVEGLVIEVMHTTTGWALVSPAVSGCPPGSFRVNGRFCIDSLPSQTLMNMHAAMDYCADRGGKLCRWDEFYHACSTSADQMVGLFTNWEWVDDTANHVHQGLQLARLSCMSQRSFSLNTLHSTRCCYNKP